jgi:hypothetical protein
VLRGEGHTVFDDWYAAGPEADDKWREYEIARGHTYTEALRGLSAQHVFGFDKRYLDLSHTAVLVCPAGKSGHLELGYTLGKGKKGYILLDSPDRWDVMYQFATGVFDNLNDLCDQLKSDAETNRGETKYTAPILPPLEKYPTFVY